VAHRRPAVVSLAVRRRQPLDVQREGRHVLEKAATEMDCACGSISMGASGRYAALHNVVLDAPLGPRSAVYVSPLYSEVRAARPGVSLPQRTRSPSVTPGAPRRGAAAAALGGRGALGALGALGAAAEAWREAKAQSCQRTARARSGASSADAPALGSPALRRLAAAPEGA
jgi:hypothetical protein